ncbi:MAG: fatty acid desaturase [Pseudomonadota bacterium]
MTTVAETTPSYGRSQVKQARFVVIAMLLFHVGAALALVVGASTTAVVAMLLYYVLRGFGITAGFHRLLAHRSFRTGRVVQFFLALFGSLAIQGGPLWWVAHHRTHHRYTETDKDIHSPRTKGFWRSHIGWMFSPESFTENGAGARDLHQYPELKWLQRQYAWIVFGQAAVIYAIGALIGGLFPETGTSGLQFVVWVYFVGTVALWHATFMVNSVCHLWGGRPFDAKDDSTNNWIVGLLALGEGWHNNHHKFANSARHGLFWWQFDLTWCILKVMSWFRLVRDLKLPNATVMEDALAKQRSRAAAT